MRKIILSALVLFIFIGCGKTTENPDDSTAIRGTVYDDLVENLGYKTVGYDSKTNWQGQFLYKLGKVDFYLGKLKIGSIPKMTDDKKVFLSDMLGLQRGDYTNARLVKLARIIQSFNLLPKWSKKITLDSDTIDKIFNTPQTLDDVELGSIPITYLVSEEEAKARVKATYIDQGIPLLTSK